MYERNNYKEEMTLVNPKNINKKVASQDKKEEKLSVTDLIQRQINKELINERVYYDMAAAADHLGFPEFAKYLYTWSDEEKTHSVRFSNFLLSQNVRPVFESLEVTPIDSDCICDFVEAIYAREKSTTRNIGKIYKKGLEEDNFKAVELAASFMKEQVEEEQKALALVKLWETTEASAIDFEMAVTALACDNKHKIASLGEGKMYY